MDLLALELAIWLPLTLFGGAIASYVLLHVWADTRADYDPPLTPDERALLFNRLRGSVSRVLGWAIFVLMGVAAAGVGIHPLLWAVAFFGTGFFWFYADLKALQIRLRSDRASDEG